MAEEPTIEEITERYQDANAKLHRATRLTDGVKAFELLTAVGHELIVAQQARIAELEKTLKPFTINAHFFEMDDPNYPAYVMVEDPDELLPGDVVIRAEHIQRAAEVLKPNQEFK